MTSRNDLFNKAKELTGKVVQKAGKTWTQLRDKTYELGDTLAAQETAAVKWDFLNAVFANFNQSTSFFDPNFRTVTAFKTTMKEVFVQGAEFTIKDLYVGVTLGNGYSDPTLIGLNAEIARIYKRDKEHTPDLSKVAIDTEKMKRLFGPNWQLNG